MSRSLNNLNNISADIINCRVLNASEEINCDGPLYAGNLTSGTYIPTTNSPYSVDSNSAFYIRYGNIVHVSGVISLIVSNTPADITFTLTLPVPRTDGNFTSFSQAAGTLTWNNSTVSNIAISGLVEATQSEQTVGLGMNFTTNISSDTYSFYYSYCYSLVN